MVKKAQDLQKAEESALQNGAAAQEQQAPEAAVEKAAEEPEKEEEPAKEEEPVKEEEPTKEEEAASQSPKISVIVLAHPGTEMLVKRIWEKHLPHPVDVLTFPEEASLKELLTDIIAAPEFEDRFVLVPANLIPVAPVSLEDLMVARVDVNKDQKRFWGRVPVFFSKDVLVDFLPENEELDDNDFVQEFLKAANVRPAEVAHSFGNFYTKVLRGNPCENIVIEALVRKRFLYANPVGWNAITGLLEKTLAE